jgi:hypothetical protein
LAFRHVYIAPPTKPSPMTPMVVSDIAYDKSTDNKPF